MRQVLIKAGQAIVAEVPAPALGDRNILVAVEYSCISSGTEVSGLINSGIPLYQRALKQPQNVALALKLMTEQGVGRTVKQIRGVLNAGQATGYSAAGRVLDVGREVEGFAPGDLVACAGAGIANHAEIIDVPVNLAVKVPPGLGLADAATVTLGSIALQGIRRANPTFGETIVVSGLGILGQLTAQLLRRSGCIVIGTEPDPARRQLALDNGIDHVLDSNAADCVERILLLSGGTGADAVLVTASSSSSGIVSDAMKACRKKGRVVLVGDVGLNLKREDFYVKELDFLVSTSYGPGRYDPYYEVQGNDYPIGYVRWTENRNMQAYLRALSRKEINLDNLKGKEIELQDVSSAYADLKRGEREGLVHLIRYSAHGPDESRSITMRRVERRDGQLSVALAGAGDFAQGTILPLLVRMRGKVRLHSVTSRRGVTAATVAQQYEAAKAGTDFEAVLSDPAVDLVVIATRHNLHGAMALAALEAGKHVFVEKPLALTRHELDELNGFFQTRENTPVLMTGFNRRFSPAARVLKSILDQRSSPLMINYRMNAGFLPLTHWVHGEEGGGRNIGEACHIYDLFNYLCGTRWVSARADAIRPGDRAWNMNDNFNATIRYDDGSVCNLIYTALGNRSHPKEQMEVFFDQRVISLDDYRSLSEAGARNPLWVAGNTRKGHEEELNALVDSLRAGGAWPITLQDQFAAMDIAFAVEEQIRSGLADARQDTTWKQ